MTAEETLSAHRPSNLIDRLAARPLFICGFRPFFLAAALYALLLLPLWLGFLASGQGLPLVPGGAVVWHAHELIFGFGLAAVAGFLLTAVPEFTATRAFGRRTVLGLALLWAAARLAFWLSGTLGAAGLALSALANLGFLGALIAIVAPRLWCDPARRHFGFLWSLLVLWLVVAGFHADLLAGLYPMRWLRAGVGVMMVLIVVASSRISMRIVNEALDAERRRDGVEAEGELSDYRARPPRRNLAIFGIALYSAVEFLLPGSAIGGWIALAAAAAVLNLLNDWHVGRALLSRWAFILYAVYWLMAAGYGLLGLALLGAPLSASAGLHLLTVGAMGLSVFGVLCIAGRTHAGYELDDRSWVAVAAVSLGFAALLRAASGLPAMPAAALQAISGAAWTLAYGLAAFRLGAVFLAPRPDAGRGCEEVLNSASLGGTGTPVAQRAS